MSPKTRFLEVEHEVIVEKEPPFFLGDELHARVKVRNLKAEPIKRRFCYILDYSGGIAWRKMEFDLGPNEEQIHSLQPPYFLGFTGNFRIALLGGEPGSRFNKEGILQIPSPHPHEVLFAGNVRDKDTYELQIIQIKTAEAVEMMSGNIDAIRESNKQIGKATEIIAKIGNITLYLTIAIAVLAAAEILTLVVGLVVG